MSNNMQIQYLISLFNLEETMIFEFGSLVYAGIGSMQIVCILEFNVMTVTSNLSLVTAS